MREQSIEAALVHFALHTKWEEIPQAVLENQKKSLIDSIGVMTAASSAEPACQPFVDFAVENSPEKSCTIFGAGKRASVLMAALANGALIHALDYEDGHDDSKSHPNTASIPVLLAIAESRGKSGREVLAAMAVASEIAIRMKLALTVNDLTDCGLYSPPMFSAYGATLGAARLLGFDEAQAMDALSICLTQLLLPGQSARSKQSVLRGIREAFSARAAAFSVMMAEKGVQARMDEPLQGIYGLYMCCFRSAYDPNVILNGLGTHWENIRLRYKMWPCCGTSHAVIHAILDLERAHGFQAEEVNEIHLVINKPHLNLLEPREVKYRPGSLAAAKFSLPFASALAVKHGRVTLDLYSDEALTDPELLSLMDKVSYELRPVEEGRPKSYYGDDHVEVTVATDGGSFTRELFVASGNPDQPLSMEQFKEKFFDCMTHGQRTYTAQQCQAIWETVLSLEMQPTLDILCGLL